MIDPVGHPLPWRSLSLEEHVEDLHRLFSLLTTNIDAAGEVIAFPLTGLNGAGDASDLLPGEQTHLHVFHEALTGTGTGPFTLANTPITGSERLHFNTLRLVRVAASPGLNEYTISGASITLGFSKQASDVFLADYDRTGTDTHGHIWAEPVTGTGTGPFPLGNTPVAGSEVLSFNTIRLVRVVSSPGVNEYTISGKDVTLGFSKQASDVFLADYLVT